MNNPDQGYQRGYPTNKDGRQQSAQHHPQQAPPKSLDDPIQMAGINCARCITAFDVSQNHSCYSCSTEDTCTDHSQRKQAIADVRNLAQRQAWFKLGANRLIHSVLLKQALTITIPNYFTHTLGINRMTVAELPPYRQKKRRMRRRFYDPVTFYAVTEAINVMRAGHRAGTAHAD